MKLPVRSPSPPPTATPPGNIPSVNCAVPAHARCPPHRAPGGPAGGRLTTAEQTVLRDHPVRKSPFLCSCHLSTGIGCLLPSLMVSGLGGCHGPRVRGSHQGAIEDWCLALCGQERQGTHSGTGTFQNVSSVRVLRVKGMRRREEKKVLRAEAGAG